MEPSPTQSSVSCCPRTWSPTWNVCDYLIVLVASRAAGRDIDTLLATHHRLTGPPRPRRLPDQHVISASHTDRQSTLLVRTDAPIHDPAWTVGQLSLEDLVLAYMGQTAASEHRPHRPHRPPADPGGQR